mmetsp:Transcript_52097/g.135123  ORF Transcript_52097/g.135123 Transcript_52097/m.135123 type:complete len:103 (-) Transcript_52097:323-631(-)
MQRNESVPAWLRACVPRCSSTHACRMRFTLRRVPLPPYKDLQSSCHLIGAGVGDHEGHMMYLCATPSPGEELLNQCELSNDFTKHYGSNVYLCRGPKVGAAV